MKAKMLGESDNFLKTKPVHNGIKACSKKVPKKKKEKTPNNRNVLNFLTIGKLLQLSWDLSDYSSFIVTDL